jgi:hypothetical protein
MMPYKIVDGKFVKDDSTFINGESRKRVIFNALIEQVKRAEAAEARAAELDDLCATLLASNHDFSEANDTLRAEVGQAWRDVVTLTKERDEYGRMYSALMQATQQQITTIRELVNAYPEHDTIEAVRRCAAMLRDAMNERDELRAALDQAHRMLAGIEP